MSFSAFHEEAFQSGNKKVQPHKTKCIKKNKKQMETEVRLYDSP